MKVRIRQLDSNGHPLSHWKDGSPEVYTDQWFESLKPEDQEKIVIGKTLNIFNTLGDPVSQIRSSKVY